MAVSIVALGVTLIIAGLLLYRPLSGGDPPMPSSAAARREILAALAAYIANAEQPPRQVVDLGSGWGGLAFRVAREQPDLPVVGVEASVVPYLFSRLRAAIDQARGRPAPRFMYRRMWSLPLRDRTVYLSYLSSQSMKPLRAQFERDQPRHGALISCAFVMPAWTPASVTHARDAFRTKVYVYRY
jgi:hypothetical protein